MKLKMTCREVTALTLQELDRHLSWHERLGVRMHRLICAPCLKFSRQTQFMRESMGRWKSYSERD